MSATAARLFKLAAACHSYFYFIFLSDACHSHLGDVETDTKEASFYMRKD
jgi:hypothetical protein